MFVLDSEVALTLPYHRSIQMSNKVGSRVRKIELRDRQSLKGWQWLTSVIILVEMELIYDKICEFISTAVDHKDKLQTPTSPNSCWRPSQHNHDWLIMPWNNEHTYAICEKSCKRLISLGLQLAVSSVRCSHLIRQSFSPPHSPYIS